MVARLAYSLWVAAALAAAVAVPWRTGEPADGLLVLAAGLGLAAWDAGRG